MENKNNRDFIGGKAVSIERLQENGFLVPQTRCLDTGFFIKYLKSNHILQEILGLCELIDLNNCSEMSRILKEKILEGEIDYKSEEIIKQKIWEINNTFLAVRSSSVFEDSCRGSFAGMYDSFLNIPNNIEDVILSVKKCWASLFNERAIVYKLSKGMMVFDQMAVILQEMIEPKYASVVYTVHPYQKDCMLIEIVSGLGESLVEGRVTPNHYIINRNTFKIMDDGQRETKIHLNLLKEISKNCLAIEKLFGFPQDIELCISEENVYYLQARPVNF